MKNYEIVKKNDELFAELQKYPEDSNEYQNIVTKIVKNNQRFVEHLARRYSQMDPTLSSDDLASEGYFGLLKAIKFFNPQKGVPFASYAAPGIKHYMSNYLKRELNHNHHTTALENDLSDNIVTVISKKPRNQKLADTIAAPVNLEAEMIERDEAERRIAWIKNHLDQLKPRQKDVITAKYLSGETVPINEVLAKQFDCSNQYISRTDIEAMAKLKEMYYTSHPEEIEVEQEAVELTNEEKIKLKEELKNLILTKLTPQQKATMLCRFYSPTPKTDTQVAQEFNSTRGRVCSSVNKATKKLRTLCHSIQDKKQLKSILEFRIEATEQER